MNLNDTQRQAERRRLAAAFDDVLTEPVPDRLSALLREPSAASAPKVIDLDAVRAQRRSMSSWMAWGGMAASLLLGAVIGTRFQAGAGDDPRQLASGPLARALDTQLASAPAGPIAVPISFKAKDGRYCRSFSGDRSAGLACRDSDGAWVVQTLVATQPSTGGMRQAASALPAAVLEAVDAAMAGEALSAEQEMAARDNRWR